ncbi:hypothetical protein Anas_01641 [Armadillidium nasatum]|uniref:Uncharacterized protein n=1 Tax=Armadillidium nasatum TaxID=96803 RepID=A0A5N5TFU1_9CRUS|nr:hypothetical protein Anas_01641 [Armadillidium nasatum]
MNHVYVICYIFIFISLNINHTTHSLHILYLNHKHISHICILFRYEIYNIDIWAFIIFVLVLVVTILVFITKFILKRCFGFGRSKIDKKKKRE